MSCDFKFNVIKSYAGCVGRSRPELSVQFYLKNKFVSWVEKFRYLGIVFNTKHGLQADCSGWIQKFIARAL